MAKPTSGARKQPGIRSGVFGGPGPGLCRPGEEAQRDERGGPLAGLPNGCGEAPGAGASGSSRCGPGGAGAGPEARRAGWSARSRGRAAHSSAVAAGSRVAGAGVSGAAWSEEAWSCRAPGGVDLLGHPPARPRGRVVGRSSPSSGASPPGARPTARRRGGGGGGAGAVRAWGELAVPSAHPEAAAATDARAGGEGSGQGATWRAGGGVMPRTWRAAGRPCEGPRSASKRLRPPHAW